MSKLTDQKGSFERAHIEVEKINGSNYWEKQTSVAHFARDGQLQSQDRLYAKENSTGTKYFTSSKWASSF